MEDKTGPARPVGSLWRRLCDNTHVCNECSALVFLLMAIGAALAGLHIAPVLLTFIAIMLASGDMYEWWNERERH